MDKLSHARLIIKYLSFPSATLLILNYLLIFTAISNKPDFKQTNLTQIQPEWLKKIVIRCSATYSSYSYPWLLTSLSLPISIFACIGVVYIIYCIVMKCIGKPKENTFKTIAFILLSHLFFWIYCTPVFVVIYWNNTSRLRPCAGVADMISQPLGEKIKINQNLFHFMTIFNSIGVLILFVGVFVGICMYIDDSCCKVANNIDQDRNKTDASSMVQLEEIKFDHFAFENE